jgi:hypothetical protein
MHIFSMNSSSTNTIRSEYADRDAHCLKAIVCYFTFLFMGRILNSNFVSLEDTEFSKLQADQYSPTAQRFIPLVSKPAIRYDTEPLPTTSILTKLLP